MYHVRFNLAAGPNFKQWQVKEVHRSGNVVFHVDPARYSIVMRHCRLVNKPRIAAQVFESQVRDVCGYVECETFTLESPDNSPVVRELKRNGIGMVVFDPKVVPYWHFENELGSIDGRKFKTLVTQGRRVYAPMREVAVCY